MKKFLSIIAAMRCPNPFAFLPMTVTIIVAVTYLAIFASLIAIHENVPPAPKNPTLYRGLNLSEAWLDLSELSNGFHPYNSRRNDEIRNWLLSRIEEILDTNGVKYKGGNLLVHEAASMPAPEQSFAPSVKTSEHEELRSRGDANSVTIFNDLVANYTGSSLTKVVVGERKAGISTYFEGNNIIVYIRGTEDEEGEWWDPIPFTKTTHGKGGVMVNAHFDSVSTGFGATDDGMGVITVLQLIKYFTTSGNTPKKGVIALLNNGEEDGLYGSKAFLSHPMADFVHTFLNLEGAGAGGRATLFRTTDTEVTRAYAKAKHPFGNVVSSDGFGLGFVRSETDYVVFRDEGYRGLDLAFYEPRSRYHTEEDDTKHTSPDSLWHMLSASVETVKSLTSDTSGTFLGPRGDNFTNKVKNGQGTDGVWFDLFGRAFAVFRLRTLFAWSLTLLIVSPLTLMLISYLLVRKDKYYFFAGAVKPVGHDHESITLNGWRGAFRFPIVLVISSALTVGGAFLLRKINPLIIYSSPYSVWTMSITLFFSSFWFLMAGCNFIRPSALHRGYALIWMFIISWGFLVAATVFEDRFKVGGGYLFVFYTCSIFLATLITLCELFALPTKASVVEASHDEHETRDGFLAVSNPTALVGGLDGDDDLDEEDAAETSEATETTPLVGGGDGQASSTFAGRYRQNITETGDGGNDGTIDGKHAFGHEQTWSANLPSWAWFLQFLLLGPFIFIIFGQVGLFLISATSQTGSDGSPILLPYLIVALFSILVVLPTGPFMHRITLHIPTFFFLLFLGTLIYNLTAFPFSSQRRYKAYFQQRVDLDTGINEVLLSGIQEHIRDIISYVPSAAGQTISCEANPSIRDGIEFCSWQGIAPQVIDNVKDGIPPEKGYKDWLTYNVTRVSGANKATFHISGQETKACILRFTEPFSAFHVHGAAVSDKWPGVPATGSDQIKLWHRDWDRAWTVDVEWPVSKGKKEGEEGREGTVVCLWSDHNMPGTIPALDEVQAFAPAWAVITKSMDGLVEGSKRFVV